MRRLLHLVAMLLLLTACATAKSPAQSQGSSGPLMRTHPPADAQEPVGKSTEQGAVPAPQPTSQSPTASTQTPAAPVPTSQSDSLCEWPTLATLQAKGKVLLADGLVGFYKMAWGANCTYVLEPHDTWVVQGNNTPMPLLREIKEFQDAQAVALPGGERGYFIEGAGTGGASRGYYLLVFRNGDQRLVSFLDGYGPARDALSSTGYPEVKGDQISVAERVGTGSQMHYNLQTWKLDSQHLYATMVDTSASYPSKAP